MNLEDYYTPNQEEGQEEEIQELTPAKRSKLLKETFKKENLKRNFRGIWIPAEIWLNEKLSTEEKVLWAEINSLQGKEGCFASNYYFALFLGKSERQIQRYLQHLEEEGFITIKDKMGKNRKIFSVLNNTTTTLQSTTTTSMSSTTTPMTPLPRHPCHPYNKVYNKDIDNKYIESNNSLNHDIITATERSFQNNPSLQQKNNQKDAIYYKGEKIGEKCPRCGLVVPLSRLYPVSTNEKICGDCYKKILEFRQKIIRKKVSKEIWGLSPEKREKTLEKALKYAQKTGGRIVNWVDRTQIDEEIVKTERRIKTKSKK
jgi:biotin operon repressor